MAWPASSSPAGAPLFPSSSSPAASAPPSQDQGGESLETSANGGSLPGARRPAAGNRGDAVAFDPLAVGGGRRGGGGRGGAAMMTSDDDDMMQQLPPSDLPFLRSTNSGGAGMPSSADGLLGGERLDGQLIGAEGTEGAASTRRRVTAGNRNGAVNWEDVPRVKDTTGETIMRQFAAFLEQFVERLPSAASANGGGGVDDDDDDGEGATPTATTPTRRNGGRRAGQGRNDADADADDAGEGLLFYIEQIRAMREYNLTTLYVDYAHLLQYNEKIAKAIVESYGRFAPYLRRALQALVRKYDPTYMYVAAAGSSTNAQGGSGSQGTNLATRDFHLAFYNLPVVSSIRDLKMGALGTLVSISGTVTRTSEVRPELVWGAFRCGGCGALVTDVEQQFKYTEPSMCQNVSTCQNRTLWTLDVEASKFADWQKVRIQENANEIPTGSMPRSLDVILRAEIVEKAKAGDKCVFTGTFIVVPDVSQLGLPGVNSEIMRQAQGGRSDGGVASQGVTGLKALGVRDLQYKTAFLGIMVQPAERRGPSAGRMDEDANDEDPEAFLNSLTQQELDELRNMVNADHIYQRLVSSIAPTVYGHEIVKKGILLQLMGGVHKQTAEGINLRGDINVCIVGDPSTSKSQFLKYVCGFLPRAVYTSGKASSAAGLTAAVVKDEESGEFTIEAGALMLADNGICAIDEFDKMDISDQVAIHEAMEQQTISIAKAGIQATLNARTSILAAANPVGGRYNRKMSLRANVAMSAPIMSRFDLFFVVLDECNEQVDFNLAQHIVNVHRFKDDAIAPEFSTEALQRYIRYARTFKPKLTSAASAVLVEKYRSLRQDDSSGPGKNSYRITVRQLESMIRLSEAIARANCKEEITPAIVREAYALLRQSIIHVEQDDIDFEDDEDVSGAAAMVTADGEDVEMNGGGASSSSSAQPASLLHGNAGSSSSPAAALAARNGGSGTSPTPAAAARPKTRITYNKYMEIMHLCVLHLSELEHTSGEGMDREDLITWYLEQKEMELESEEAFEQEREIVSKALTRLVKDQYLLELRGRTGGALIDSSSSSDQATATGGSASTGASQEDQDMAGGDNEGSSGAAERKVHYVVHPSVDVGDLSSSLSAR